MSNDNSNISMISLGWDQHFEQHFEPYKSDGLVPGRVEAEHRNLYRVVCESGHVSAEVSGRFINSAVSRGDYPAVGDWVVMNLLEKEQKGIIQAVLERKSCFSRKAVLSGGMPDTGGKTAEQVLAANIDTVFLVSGLDHDFNIRRIERYVTVAYNSGATPVIILNKADLRDDLDECVSEVQDVAAGVDVLPVSAASGTGLDALERYLAAGKTVAFLGSSGVGKSTIINTLLGEQRLKTREVSGEDSRGRHTTTHRELIVLPDGGVVIDTPGMREISLWDDSGGLERAFDDIEEFARQCRFQDCSHQNEPGCAVQAALAEGRLNAARYSNYVKLQKEINAFAIRKDKQLYRQTTRERDKKHRRYFKEMQKVNKKFRER